MELKWKSNKLETIQKENLKEKCGQLEREQKRKREREGRGKEAKKNAKKGLQHSGFECGHPPFY